MLWSTTCSLKYLVHLLTSKLITHITWPICRDLLHDRIPVAPIAHTRSRTPIRADAAAAGALGQLSLDRFCYLGRFRYRSLSPTAQHPEKQCDLISNVVGRTFEQATRHFARLDNTPAEEGSMQHAGGSRQQTADSGRQWVNLWQCCKSKRVSGLSIMCNATAHKISVPERRSTRNYKIVRRQYPVGSPFALIRCRRPSDRPGDQADRLTDRANHEHLAKQSQQEDAAATRRDEAGKARRGDRDACGAIRSRCKPLIRSCRYLQILSSSQRRKLRL